MTQQPSADDAMPRQFLGKNGPKVSRFALGTMTFGVETPEAEAFGQLDVFVERGGTFIDTADVYGGGLSETIIGKWGQARGGMDDLVVATKGRFAPPAGSAGASRRALTRSVEGSLQRLQIEAIDIYFIHGWDEQTELFETLSVLDDLVRSGKINNIAWSNVSAWQLQKIIDCARSNSLPVPVALQPQYNLLDRGIEMEVLPCCLEAGIAVTPWSPLGGGWLTGKYKADTMPTGATRLGENPERGVEAYDLRNTKRTHDILTALEDIAAHYERPMSHVALAWLASRPGVTSILLGARSVAQLQENLDAVDLVLTAEELDRLTQVSSLGPVGYPYNFLTDWCEMAIWQKLGTFLD